MENQLEVLETQNNPEVTAPTAEEDLSVEQMDDLKYKAAISSQNFERAKKAENEVKELRAQLEELTNNEVPPDDILDEGTIKLKAKIFEIEKKLEKNEVLGVYPELKDLWDDFETFRDEPDNAGLHLKTAAKAFLVEKGILEPKRKGLEKPTGGRQVPTSPEMNNEELKKLRETDFRKYREMLKKGQIKV